MPPQKRGRPRRWCSQQCRQKAYEERHGLTSWSDQQPKVTGLSEVVEAPQDRAANRAAFRSAERRRNPQQDAPHDCTFAVWQDQIEMSIIVDRVANLIAHQAFHVGAEGRILAESVARLVNAVDLVTMRVAGWAIRRDPPQIRLANRDCGAVTAWSLSAGRHLDVGLALSIPRPFCVDRIGPALNQAQATDRVARWVAGPSSNRLTRQICSLGRRREGTSMNSAMTPRTSSVSK